RSFESSEIRLRKRTRSDQRFGGASAARPLHLPDQSRFLFQRRTTFARPSIRCIRCGRANRFKFTNCFLFSFAGKTTNSRAPGAPGGGINKNACQTELISSLSASI